MAIKCDLQESYQTATLQKILNIAKFLDPHYKDLPFLDSGGKQRMLEDVEDELVCLLDKTNQ